MASQLNTFVYSSFRQPPALRLEGYAFAGTDFVIGDMGAQDLLRQTGRVIEPGLDGCYAIVRRKGESTVFGTDHSGFAKLFYYDDGETWAVSNSFAVLVDHLRAHRIALRINYPQLASLGGKRQLTGQLTSFSTIIHGINLLPSYGRLILRDGQLTVSPGQAPRRSDYKSALSDFIGIWTARLSTILKDDRVDLTSDLTGGVDSRTTFAIAARAVEDAQVDRHRLRLLSSTHQMWAADYHVASQLAQRYGYTLNASASHGTRFHRPELVYQQWRDVCLGVYLSVYLPSRSRDVFDIHMHGGGGENHRIAYGGGSPDAVFDKFGKHIPPHFDFEWKQDALSAIDTLSTRHPGLHPLMLHYREFRNRFHSGRSPLYSVTLTPLSSELLDRATAHLPSDGASQINFDILESLLPGLSELPYDVPTKAPSERDRARLTVVGSDARHELGRIYGPERRGEDANSVLEDSSFDFFCQRARDAMRDRRVVSFLGREAVQDGLRNLEDAVEVGRFKHASAGRSAAYALAAQFVLR